MNKVLTLIILVISLVSSSVVATGDDTLLMAIEISRHGSRSPKRKAAKKQLQKRLESRLNNCVF